MVAERTPARFDLLARSESGLSYVRERNGITRSLTPSELADFNDPPPCPECAEQFGCAHYNCAREPMLSEEEIEREVPAEWLGFAKDYGVSRDDLHRLNWIELAGDEYRIIDGATTDVRMLEIVLLLNGR